MEKVLFVVGPHAGGKTFSTKKYLSDNNIRDVTMIDTGPIMRELHNKSGHKGNIGEWVSALEREKGNTITSVMITDEIRKRLNSRGNQKAILIGFRTLETIRFVIQELGLEDYSVLYVDGSFSLLYRNYLRREHKNITIDEYLSYLAEEQSAGLRVLKKCAISKESGFTYFHKRSNKDSFEDFLLSSLGYEPNIKDDKSKTKVLTMNEDGKV